MATKTFKIGLSNADKAAMAQDVYEMVEELLFEEYDSSKTYNKGDYVVYSDALYRCKEDNVTGAWNSSKWESATLEDLVDDVNSAVASVNGKANIIDLENGSLVPAKSSFTENIVPVSKYDGDTQEVPFINQGTGTGNGTASVDTGATAQQIEKQGSVYCVNQLVQNGNFADTSGWGVSSGSSFSVADNIGTFTASAQNKQIYQTINCLTGNKYIVSLKIKLTTATDLVKIIWNGTTIASTTSNTNWQTFNIFVDLTTNYHDLCIRDTRSSDWDAIQIENVNIIDLTQWFNGNDNIPTDLITNPSHFSWYHNYGDYIQYNTGELVACNGRYLECGQGRNVYNPEETYNQVISNKTYFASKTTTITYYDKNKNSLGTESVSAGTTFNIPSDCIYINSSVANITISLYYTVEQGGEGYLDNGTPIEYPYEEPKTYDTGTEELLSTGVSYNAYGERTDAHDTKAPDGLITHNVGRKKISELTGGFVSSTNTFSFSLPTDAKTISGDWGAVKPNLRATRYISSSFADRGDMKVWYNFAAGSWYIVFRDTRYSTLTEFTNSLTNNDYVYYELASPTTEQGTPFAENIDINDYSYMKWDTQYVPQGVKVFYPAWYVGFVSSLGQRAEWDASKIVLQSDLNFKELANANIGAITTTEIVNGAFYKNEIAITSGLTNAKYVSALMSNGNLYPMMKTSSSLVVFNGVNFQANSITVSKIYYKE